jgi:Zn-dependent protease with chaperone function
MCTLCYFKQRLSGPTSRDTVSPHAWNSRRGFLLAAASAAAASPALAQVDVGKSSQVRNLVPAESLEKAASQQYAQTLSEARAKSALAADTSPQLVRLRTISQRLIPFAGQWNGRVSKWTWEVNLINSKQINAWCMPGGKIAFYTGILDELKLTDDETAMIMGHEMAHALREHARERLAKSQATGIGLSVLSQLLGLGQMGDVAANLGTQLLSMKYSRDDETEADLVGLEIAARGGFQPSASVDLWNKMAKAAGDKGGPAFLSTHPSGPERIKQLGDNVPKVQGLYEKTRKG